MNWPLTAAGAVLVSLIGGAFQAARIQHPAGAAPGSPSTVGVVPARRRFAVDDDGTTREELTATAAMLRRLSAGIEDVRQVVPRILRVSAALGWRLLVVMAALYVLGIVVRYLAPLVVPVAIALLLAALLAPAVGFLARHRVRRGLAAALVLVGALVVLGGMLTFVVITFIKGLP